MTLTEQLEKEGCLEFGMSGVFFEDDLVTQMGFESDVRLKDVFDEDTLELELMAMKNKYETNEEKMIREEYKELFKERVEIKGLINKISLSNYCGFETITYDIIIDDEIVKFSVSDDGVFQITKDVKGGE